MPEVAQSTAQQQVRCFVALLSSPTDDKYLPVIIIISYKEAKMVVRTEGGKEKIMKNVCTE